MKRATWTCHEPECGAKGDEGSAKAAMRAFYHHIAEFHNEVPW